MAWLALYEVVRGHGQPGHLVTTFFQNLNFRRFQVELSEPSEMDDAGPETLDKLQASGRELADKILSYESDIVQYIKFKDPI